MVVSISCRFVSPLAWHESAENFQESYQLSLYFLIVQRFSKMYPNNQWKQEIKKKRLCDVPSNHAWFCRLSSDIYGFKDLKSGVIDV